MTIYKTVDDAILKLCDRYLDGKISIGEFQESFLLEVRKIISIEDKLTKERLLDLEATLDSKLALYYGAEGIDNLFNMFFNDDLTLRNITKDIVDNIKLEVLKINEDL